MTFLRKKGWVKKVLPAFKSLENSEELEASRKKARKASATLVNKEICLKLSESREPFRGTVRETPAKLVDTEIR